MLKKNASLFKNLFFASDLAIIAFSWLLAYVIRFESGLVPIYYAEPHEPWAYVFLTLPVLAIWVFTFRVFNLYRPRRISSYAGEVWDLAKASFFSLLMLVTLNFFLRQFEISRLVLGIFFVVSVTALSLQRVVLREALRKMRKRGFNTRRALIIGTGAVARQLRKRFDHHPELGITVHGFLTDTDEGEVNTDRIDDGEVLGSYRDVREVIEKRDIDHVYLALGIKGHRNIGRVLEKIGDEAVAIKAVPDIYELVTLRGGVEELDGMPIVSLQDSPMYGWDQVAKRIFDVAASLACITASLPIMAAVVIGIKLTSPGPIFFRQERMSEGGKTFQMLKFRSMKVDAEDKSGPQWAKKDDPRRTRFGTFLRKTSLDELPQFINVLKGDMSIIGPRPERPVFIKDFRNDIPRYMLRHKMKAGITGWAQVNGLRGNTDLKKRIDYDIYYIEHWSLWFDLKIFLMTFWKGFVSDHAY